jgi:hypothetical protein
MAGLNDNLDKANKLLKQIEATYKRLGETNPFNGMDPEKISTSEKEIKKLEVALEGITNRAYNLEEGFGGITAAISASLAEMDNANNATNRTVKAMRGIKSITQDLANDQAGLVQLSLKELQNKENKLKTLSQEARTQSYLVKDQYEGFNLDKNGDKLMGAALNNRLKKLGISKSEAQKIEEILAAEEEGLTVLDKALDKTKERIEYEKDINKKLGITGGLLKGISKIPILGDVFDANEAVSEMDKHLRAGGSSVGALGKGLKNIGKQMKDGVLNSSNMMLAAFTFIISALKNMDKGAGEFAKGMNVSYSEALKTREEMASLATASGDAALNADNLLKTTTAVGQSLGTNAEINKADSQIMTKLVQQAGFQHDELMNIQKLSLVNGKTLEDNTKEILGGASAYATRNGIALNEKTILKEVNNMSAALKLSLGASAKEMAKAAVQAKAFGINLQQAESIASSMLDFESSIEAELSAELLTGKNINLEKARGLALEGKSAEAAAEILKQVGGTAEFSKMNVIQQEAMAKAVGMQREELAASLIEREALAKIGAKDAEEARKKYDSLVSQFGVEEAQKRLGDEQLALQFEQQSNAEKFTQAVEKIKDIFVSIMDGPLGSILNMFSTLLDNAGVLYTITGAIAAIFAGKMVMGLGMTIAKLGIALGLSLNKAAAEITAASALTLGLGTIGIMVAAAAAIGGLYALTKPKPVQDAAIDPKGGLIISGPKGTYQGDPNDTVIMGTGIGKGKGKTTPQQGGGGGTVNIDMTQTNALLQRLIDTNLQVIKVIQTEGSVLLDGQKVGTALKLGFFKTQ